MTSAIVVKPALHWALIYAGFTEEPFVFFSAERVEMEMKRKKVKNPVRWSGVFT